MPKRKIVDEGELIRWLEEGRTYAWMVEQYREKYDLEVVGSMFSNFRRRRGLDRRIQRDDDLIPWHVSEEHRWSYAVQMLRAEARRRSGLPVKASTEHRLSRWLEERRTRDEVVDYHPDRGFSYVPRSEGDLDIIRAPITKSTLRRNAG